MKTCKIVVYSSDRKNAAHKTIKINNNYSSILYPDHKIPDTKISYHIHSIFYKTLQVAKKYNHLEVSFSTCGYVMDRVQCDPLQLLNIIYCIYCMLHPYNKISFSDLVDNPSIREAVERYV